MPFKRRVFVEILHDMIDHVQFNTALSDYRVGAVIRTILEAAALEDDEAYFQMAQLLKDYAYTSATGAELDRRLADFDFTREQSQPALCQIIITAPRPVPADTPLVAPITVYADETQQHPRVEFTTTLNGLIPVGSMASAPMPIVATAPGSVTNIPAGEISFLGSPIPGLEGATCVNPISAYGGRDAESDDELRARARRHLRALPRGTVSAVEGKAIGVRAFSPVTGELAGQVSSALLREERPGESTLFVLDATNRFGQATEALLAPEVLTPAATLGQRHLQVAKPPLLPRPFVLTIREPGIPTPLVLSSSDPATAPLFDLDDTTGVVTLRTLPSVPIDYSFKDPVTGLPSPGLPPGSNVEATYTRFTGLIAETQRVLNGDEKNRLTHPGWKAAGTRVRVRFPLVREILVRLALTPREGFQRASLIAPVTRAVEQYVNGLRLGVEVVLARIIDLAMSVVGVFDVTVFQPTGNVAVLEEEIARAPRGNVIVT